MRLSSDAIAEYALDLSIDDLPDKVVDHARRLTLDTLACAIGAYTTPPSKHLRRIYGDRTGSEQAATVFGDGSTVDLEHAALLNGTMGRYLDFNDCYTTRSSACHPSDHIPALVSVAEAEGADGAALIESVVLAYELQCRGVDTGAAWEHGFDYTTWGAYSATASIGRLMGLDHEALTHALGIAGTANNGLLISRLDEVSMWKGVAMPYVLQNAVQACQMARAGVTGPVNVFDGQGGFFEAVAGEPVAFDAIGGRDGAGYRITETGYKAFACGYFSHPSVTAALDILREHELAPAEIRTIEIRTFTDAVDVYASGPEKWSPDLSRETADHSLPYNVSVAVLDGEVTPEQYDEAHLRDERVHAMMDRVAVEADPDLDRYRREHPRHVPARVRIGTAEGSYETRVDYPLGHPERPMSDEQLAAKAAALVDPYLSDAQFDRLVAACRGLDGADTVDRLVGTLVV